MFYNPITTNISTIFVITRYIFLLLFKSSISFLSIKSLFFFEDLLTDLTKQFFLFFNNLRYLPSADPRSITEEFFSISLTAKKCVEKKFDLS